MQIKKNMKPGNKSLIYLIGLLFFYNTYLFTDDRIISSPLVNLEEIKPSFEEVETENNDFTESNKIQNKKKIISG